MKIQNADVTDVVILSCSVMAGTTIIRHMQEKPKDKTSAYVRPVFFGFFLAVALLVLAVPLPTFTKGLAYLGLVGAFAVNGPAIFKLAGGK